MTFRRFYKNTAQPFISLIHKVSTYSWAKLSHLTSIKQLNERGQKANSEFEFTSNSELEFSAVREEIQIWRLRQNNQSIILKHILSILCSL